MENLKHTKGEWKIRGNKIFVDYTYRSLATIHVIRNYKEVTFEPIEDIEAIANAKLIAAAPQLLEALIRCRKWIDEHGKDFEIGVPSCFLNAKKVIKQATE
jgi:hypothetical protein